MRNRLGFIRTGGGHPVQTIAFQMVALLMTGLLFVGCGDEPFRDNPADPGSSVYNPDGTLMISVRDRNGDALSGAEILFDALDMSVFSNSSGEASIDLLPGDHTFLVHFPGFVGREETANIPFRATRNRTIALNGAPSIDSVYFRTLMVVGSITDSGEKSYYYNVFSRVQDLDGLGDVEDVLLYEEEGAEPIVLTLNQQEQGWYSATRDFGSAADEFSRYVHRPMRLLVRDELADTCEQTVSIESMFYYKFLWEDMIQSTTLSAVNPTFAWVNAKLSISRNQIWFETARYRLEVFKSNETTSVIDTLLTFNTTVSPDTFRVTWEGTLDTGIFYDWRLTMYDPFDNAVRTGRWGFQAQ